MFVFLVQQLEVDCLCLLLSSSSLCLTTAYASKSSILILSLSEGLYLGYACKTPIAVSLLLHKLLMSNSRLLNHDLVKHSSSQVCNHDSFVDG